MIAGRGLSAAKLAALAMILAPVPAIAAAPPVPAQPGSVSSESEARFIALSDALIENIGTADTVIMLYVALDATKPDGSYSFLSVVQYSTPDGKVRTRGNELLGLPWKLFEPAVQAYQGDHTWRSATVVIDHGRATVRMHHAADFDATQTFDQRSAAETARVFPGLPVEPYVKPAAPTAGGVPGAQPVAAATAAPEAKPFGNPDAAENDVRAALVRAKATGHRVILVFGANWCHDSRALAGWFATPRFAAMLRTRYEIVWVDVGNKDRNIDLARRYRLKGIKGTPTVLVLDSAAKPLNLKDAPGWRNASTRSETAIYDYFAGAPVTSG